MLYGASSLRILIDADQFADPEFFELYEDECLKFVADCASAVKPIVAFRNAFGSAQMGKQGHDGAASLAQLQSNPVIEPLLRKAIEAKPSRELWSPAIALNWLRALTNDNSLKENVRLNAAKELNVICGITVVDESGVRKQGRSLADFYAQAGNHTPPPSAPNEGSKAPGLRLASSS